MIARLVKFTLLPLAVVVGLSFLTEQLAWLWLQLPVFAAAWLLGYQSSTSLPRAIVRKRP